MVLIVQGSAFPKKKSCLEQMFHLGTQMAHPTSQLWIHCKECFAILHNERAQERHGNDINVFSERNVIQSNLFILEQKWYGVLITLDLLSGFFINFTQ